MNLAQNSQELMRKATEENKAPAWLLTELAVKKGRELAQKHNVDEELVVSSLYLAHTVFSDVWQGEVQKNHPELSAGHVKKYLNDWNVEEENQKIILNAIEAHHNKIPSQSKIAEVVKNAECFKFVTVKGSLIWLHECGKRGYSFDESVEKVLAKMNQKKGFLTLADCKEEAEKNIKEIEKIFSFKQSLFKS